MSVPGRAYKLPTCVCARAYSVQDNIINFDCDHVLFSIRNQLLRTRITFLRGVRRRCMHRINVTTIITECVCDAVAAFDVHSLLDLFTQILKFLCVHFGFLNDRLCSRSHLTCSSNHFVAVLILFYCYYSEWAVLQFEEVMRRSFFG